MTVHRQLTREDRRSLNNGKRAAAALLADPEGVIDAAATFLPQQRRASLKRERPWIEVWEAILKLPPEILAGLLVDTGEFARALRATSPFGAVIARVDVDTPQTA